MPEERDQSDKVEQKERRLAGTCILIIDNDQRQAGLAADILGDEGARVDLFLIRQIQSLDALNAQLSTGRYDVLLIDTNLEFTTGPKVAQAVRDAGFTGVIVGYTVGGSTSITRAFEEMGIDWVAKDSDNYEQELIGKIVDKLNEVEG
jgi:DNA-binding NtrC family response regulator